VDTRRIASVALVAFAAATLAQSVQARRAEGVVAVPSGNWAGYAVVSPTGSSAVSFTSVTGTWTQPNASCSAAGARSASEVWVGLGGYALDAQALEQIGTGVECSPSGASVSYAWYELVPAPLVKLVLTIKPGDVLTGSVTVGGGNVVLQLRNRTRNTVVTRRIAVSEVDVSSAEWIAEAPSLCTGPACSPLALANFGTVSFSRAAVTGNGSPGTLTTPSWATVALRLVPRAASGAGSVPGAVSSDGTSFSVSWLAGVQPPPAAFTPPPTDDGTSP